MPTPKEYDELEALLSGSQKPIGPLSGYLGVALVHMLAGPFAASQLEQQGATIIKIETSKGDATRNIPPMTDLEGESVYHASVNCGTHSIDLDLRNKADREILDRLLEKADFFLHNLSADALEKLQYGHETIAKKFPHLINCQISGDGVDGSKDGAFNENILAKLGYIRGPQTVVANGVQRSMHSPVSIADLTTGMQAAFGIASALADRPRRMARGENGGAFIDVSMVRSSLAMIPQFVGRATKDGKKLNIPPLSERSTMMVPFGVFSCKESEMTICVLSDEMFAKLADVLEFSNEEKELYSSVQQRIAKQDDLHTLMLQKLSAKDADEWSRLMKDVGVACEPVRTITEAMSNPSIQDQLIPVMSSDGNRMFDVGRAAASNRNYRERESVRGPDPIGRAKAMVLEALERAKFTGNVYKPSGPELVGAGDLGPEQAPKVAKG